MTGNSVPRHIIAFDTISQRINNRGDEKYYPCDLQLAVASYCKIECGRMQRIQTLCCECNETFWQWVYSRIKMRQTMWIVGHRAIEHFNLLGGWGRVESGELKLKTLVDSDPPSILMLSWKGRTINVCDVRNWGDESVQDIAESVKVTLYPDPDDFSGDLERENYLTARVIAIRDWFGSLLISWNESKLGKFRMTASGLAWSAYKTNHLPRGVLVHNCAESLEMERQALAGGYTRVFRAGDVREKVYVYDVNSLYPSVMLNLQAPCEWRFWLESCTMDQMKRATEKHQVIAEVAVDQEDYPYPARANNERCWPIGRYYTTLCGDELLHAIEHDHIKRIWRVSVYSTFPMFKSWVQDMYGRRLDAAGKGLSHRERMFKLLLNSLCGRLGMRRQGWEWVDWQGWRPQWGTFPFQHPGETAPNTYRSIAGNVQVMTHEAETGESMPAIEAVINANARYRMYRDRKAIGEEHILYQGVDSLHLTEAGHHAMRQLCMDHKNILGAYKLVSVHDYACYRGPMDYSLDDVHTVCGVTVPKGNPHYGNLVWSERDTARLSLHRDPSGIIWVRERERPWGHVHVDGIITEGNRVIPPLIQTDVALQVKVPTLKTVAICPDWSKPHMPYCGDNERK